MEHYARTADSGRTVDSTDHRSACLITLDGNADSDSESIHIQIERTAILSVKREKSLLQQKYPTIDLTVLYEEVILCLSHYSEVFDPPVSMQTDEGVVNGQSQTGPWHQVHRRFCQSHIHDLHTGRTACLFVKAVQVSTNRIYRSVKDKWGPYSDRLYWTSPMGDTDSVPEISGTLMDLSFCWIEAIPSCLPRKKQENFIMKLRSDWCFSIERGNMLQTIPYSRPFSVSLTFTPGLVLKVMGIKATRASQQYGNILTAGK